MRSVASSLKGEESIWSVGSSLKGEEVPAAPAMVRSVDSSLKGWGASQGGIRWAGI